jgi:signal transduction histidine kinase
MERTRTKFPWLRHAVLWSHSKRTIFAVMVFCFMLAPAVAVNFGKVVQYLNVQEYYLNNFYAEKSDTVWKHLWLQTQVLKRTAESLSQDTSLASTGKDLEQLRLVDQVKQEHLSFAAEVGIGGRIQIGASQYLLPNVNMRRKRKLGSYYAGLVPSDMVAGTGMEKGYEQGLEALYRGKHIYPELVMPLAHAEMEKSRVVVGCRLKKDKWAQTNQAGAGFALLDTASLACLGIEKQVVGSEASGLVAMASAPIHRGSKIVGYLIVGQLINNLYPLSEYLIATESTYSLTFFAKDKAVLTSITDEKGDFLLDREMPVKVKKSVLEDGWFDQIDHSVNGKTYNEAFQPLLGFDNLPVGGFSVARGERLKNYLAEFAKNSWWETGLILLIIWVLGWPIRKLFGEQIEALELSNHRQKIAFENLDEGILSIDHEGRILFCNKYAREALGLEELQGKYVSEFTDLSVMARFIEATQKERISELGSERFLERFTGNFVTSAKEKLKCEYSVGSADVDQWGISYFLIFRDTSIRDELEEKRRWMSVLEDRRRIARDIHDGLTSKITAVKVQLEAGLRKLGKGNQDGINRLQLAYGLSVECLDEATSTVDEIRSASKDLYSLERNLERTAKAYDSETLSVRFVSDSPIPKVGKEYLDGVVLIVQEAIRNALKHSRASELIVSVNCDNENTTVRIEDNGIGIDKITIMEGDTGLGIKSMVKRAEEIGGQLCIESQVGSGTCIQLVFPNVTDHD